MSKLKLEDLLEDLRDDGVIVSSGGFTLDPSKAEEKLRDFSFPSPDDYILKLIGKGPVYDDKKLKPEMPGKEAAPFQDEAKPV